MRTSPPTTTTVFVQHRVGRARLLALATALLAASTAHAQDSTALKASAYDAQQTAAEAQAKLEAARRESAEAAERLAAAEAAAKTATTEAAARAAAVQAAPAAATATDIEGELEAARAEAQQANQRANEALAAVEELKKRFAYDRTGFYMGGAVFWAPEAFDAGGVSVGNSRGLSGTIGYRANSFVAIEARYDYFDDFDLAFAGSVDDFAGTLTGWSATANAKIYMLTGRVQPYLGLGLGAFSGTVAWRNVTTGEQSSDRETNVLFRASGGFDLYVTPSVLLNFDASFGAVGGNLSAVKYGQLGGGVTFRF